MFYSLLSSYYLNQAFESDTKQLFFSLWGCLSWKPWFQEHCRHQKIKLPKSSKNDYFFSLCNPYSKGRTLKKFFSVNYMVKMEGKKSHRSWALPELIYLLDNMASFFISLLKNLSSRGLGDIHLFDALSCTLKYLTRGLILFLTWSNSLCVWRKLYYSRFPYYSRFLFPQSDLNVNYKFIFILSFFSFFFPLEICLHLHI